MLVFFTAMSSDSVKQIFNNKVKELNDASSHRSLFLDNERYNNVLRDVKEAQILRKNNQLLTSKHYRRLKRYDVMKIGDTQILLKVIQAKMMIQTFVTTARRRSCLMSWNSTCQHRTQKDKRKRHCFVCDFAKSFSLSLPSYIFVSFFQSWKLN
jgi:hypothetical protein